MHRHFSHKVTSMKRGRVMLHLGSTLCSIVHSWGMPPLKLDMCVSNSVYKLSQEQKVLSVACRPANCKIRAWSSSTSSNMNVISQHQCSEGNKELKANILRQSVWQVWSNPQEVQWLQPIPARTKYSALSNTLTCSTFAFEISQKTQVTHSVSELCHILYQARSGEMFSARSIPQSCFRLFSFKDRTVPVDKHKYCLVIRSLQHTN